MTNCTLKRLLKAVPTHTRNRPDPKALLWMTNRCSRCLDEMRSSLGLICLLGARRPSSSSSSGLRRRTGQRLPKKERFSKETSDLYQLPYLSTYFLKLKLYLISR
ncbi:hypothetical protein M0804_002591 [Polistes exclamans]|nr:hypothetical protein M0804_002591 [Polistes exclamans]